jgi:hypothetical protein
MKPWFTAEISVIQISVIYTTYTRRARNAQLIINSILKCITDIWNHINLYFSARGYIMVRSEFCFCFLLSANIIGPICLRHGFILISKMPFSIGVLLLLPKCYSLTSYLNNLLLLLLSGNSTIKVIL